MLRVQITVIQNHCCFFLFNMLTCLQIPQGGKVPKSMYVKKSDKLASEGKESYANATIKKGEKLKLNFLAAQEGSFLKYSNFPHYNLREWFSF